MAELRAPEQNRLLGQLANMLRATEGDIAAPEFLPRGLDVMGLVRQLMLPSAETVEKLSYGDPLFRMPTQSNIPITADREYLADIAGMIPFGAPAARPSARAMQDLVRQIQTEPPTGAISPEIAARFLPETKVVDEAGKPLVVYHGTSKEFDEFVVPDGKRASFFTTNPEFANEYAKFRGGNVVPVYIDAKKPWDYENPKDMKEFQKFLGLTDEEVELPQGFDEGEQYLAASNGQWDFIESDEFQRFLKQKGYDAFYVKENGVKNLGVFDPNQIKSAVSDPQMAGLLDQPAQSVVSNSLSDIVKKAQDKKIDLQVAETDTVIDVGLIKVPKRGKGLGTEAMKELIGYADATGKPIRLVPDPNIARNVDPDRLVSFYERLGFVKQEPVTSQAMSGSTFRQFAPTYWVYTPK